MFLVKSIFERDRICTVGLLGDCIAYILTFRDGFERFLVDACKNVRSCLRSVYIASHKHVYIPVPFFKLSLSIHIDNEVKLDLMHISTSYEEGS